MINTQELKAYLKCLEQHLNTKELEEAIEECNGVGLTIEGRVKGKMLILKDTAQSFGIDYDSLEITSVRTWFKGRTPRLYVGFNYETHRNWYLELTPDGWSRSNSIDRQEELRKFKNLLNNKELFDANQIEEDFEYYVNKKIESYNSGNR